MSRDSSQADKFKKAARELTSGDSEKDFDEKLKRLAKAPPPKDDKDKSKDKTPDE